MANTVGTNTDASIMGDRQPRIPESYTGPGDVYVENRKKFFMASGLGMGWFCLKCGSAQSGNFCQNCGSEKPGETRFQLNVGE